MVACELRDFQVWMYTFLTAPGDEYGALKVAERAAGFPANSVERLVLPSSRLDPLGRMMIYRRQYLLRMEDALAIDYPGVKKFLGQQRFFELVKNYVQAFPSRSYTLNHLGEHLVEFLHTTDMFAGDEAGFVRDLARLEYALVKVCNAPSVPVLTPADLQMRSPDELLEHTYTLIPALELLKVDYNVNRFLREPDMEREELVELLSPAKTYAVVWRDTRFDSWRLELEEAQYCFLTLLKEGKVLSDVIEEVLARYHDLSMELPFRWFCEWVEEEMLSRD